MTTAFAPVPPVDPDAGRCRGSGISRGQGEYTLAVNRMLARRAGWTDDQVTADLAETFGYLAFDSYCDRFARYARTELDVAFKSASRLNTPFVPAQETS